MRIEEKEGSLVIVDFNEFEAYKIARRIETDGIHFYKRLIEKTTEKDIKGILLILLKEEEDHLRRFGGLLDKLEQEKEDIFEEDDLMASLDYGIFKPFQDIADLDKILNNPPKVIKLGLVIEEKSIKFYESCRKHIADPKAKKELSIIIDEEYSHKKKLENILNGKSGK